MLPGMRGEAGGEGRMMPLSLTLVPIAWTREAGGIVSHRIYRGWPAVERKADVISM